MSLRQGAGHGSGGRTSLEEAAATGLPVEGVITAVNKGGVEVDVAGTRAFCPLSQLELRQVVDPAAYIGQRLEFRVTRYEDDRRGANVVLSRRALLEEAMQSRAVETRSKLVVGAVLPGVVTALKDFGAFVDVGGIEGLLPASEIGFQRNTRPADVLSVGQPITVAVMRVEKRDNPRRPEQVSFSLKSLERDPWQDAAAELPAGTLTRGQVTRVEQFGAFVELRPGVEALLAHQRAGRAESSCATRATPPSRATSSRSRCSRSISRSGASRWGWARARRASTTRGARRPRASRARAGEWGRSRDLLKGKLQAR